MSVSHFELLGLPKGLDVDDDALDEGLRVLQRRLHPDRFASAPEAQKLLADAASARVSNAGATAFTAAVSSSPERFARANEHRMTPAQCTTHRTAPTGVVR